MKRIGIFGGTFDPIHNGHLIIAENVREQMQLDTVLFIPSGKPSLKNLSGVSDSSHRLNMVKLAVKNNPSFTVSDIEITDKSGEPSFTVDTLLKLREQYLSEQVKFYLIIGMDQLIDLHKWKDPGKLFLLSEVVVVNRPGFLIQQVDNDYSRQAIMLPVPNIDISSSDIRFRVQESRSIKYLVPDSIEKYISEHKLYK